MEMTLECIKGHNVMHLLEISWMIVLSDCHLKVISKG